MDAEFQRWSESFGPFDVDACCDPKGANSHCTRFWSDCLSEQWRGLFVWCNPPFTCPRTSIESILTHFVSEWRADPEHTSAVFILPDFQGSWRRLLKRSGMRVVHVYPRGSSIFVTPDGHSPPTR